MNESDVGIGVVTASAALWRCGALPPCSRLDWRSCWLNNSLLRPPHSGRHAWTWLSRCKGSHIPPSISSRRSTRRRRRTKRANDGLACLDAIELMQSQRRVDSNEWDLAHRNQFILYVLSGQRWTYRAIRRN